MITRNKDFYSKTNKTERYLFEINLLLNFHERVLKAFNAFEYKRVFLGEFYDSNSKDKGSAFGLFVVIDSTENTDYDFKLKALLGVLQGYKTLYHSSFVNPTSITIVLRLGLSESQLKHFFDSKYSKIYLSKNNTYTVLELKSIKNYFRLPITEASSEIDKKLQYENAYLILKHDESYFNYFIEPSLANLNYSVAMLNIIKNNEYDEKIKLEEELYDIELITNLN